MKTIGCFLFLIVLGCGNSFAQKTVATYQYVYEHERDGRPSKCDCDYHKKSLVLMKDSSFTLEEIRGRLDPKTEFREKGTWKIANDSVLVLTVSKTVSILNGEEQVSSYRKTFIIDRWGSHINESYGEEKWTGKGLVRTSRQQQLKSKP